MDIEIPDDLIEIHDPQIDPAQIMEQIRERIRRRREELGYPRQQFPTFGAAAYPGEPEGEDFDADLYHHLRKVNDVYYQVDVGISLAPSPATQLPILGRLWKRIRQEAHNLVLFYVGKLARQQVAINRHMVSTLNRMAVQLQEQQQELQALRDEVKQFGERPDASSERTR
jgi:hypothetical protein